MKLRIVPKSQLKKAYEKEYEKDQFDVDDEIDVESIDKVPEELFLIIKETLKFIEKVNEEEDK